MKHPVIHFDQSIKMMIRTQVLELGLGAEVPHDGGHGQLALPPLLASLVDLLEDVLDIALRVLVPLTLLSHRTSQQNYKRKIAFIIIHLFFLFQLSSDNFLFFLH